MRAVKEYAYAKINLFLDVVAKREDGYHDIDTVMHTVSLCDELTLTVSGHAKRGVKLLIDGNKRLPSDGKNIAYAAAILFLDKLGIDDEITVKLVKRIPMSAGLAGGSADGAAVLRGMNRLYGKPLTEKMLLSLAEKLGSDLPFCLIGGVARCQGRGERMTRLSDTLALHTVIAVSDEFVSTPEAYSALDEKYFDGKSFLFGREEGANAMSRDINSGEFDPGKMYNIFEDVILGIRPGAARIKARLESLGAVRAQMSGSGPSVFGIFDSAERAKAARDILLSEGINAHYAASV